MLLCWRRPARSSELTGVVPLPADKWLPLWGKCVDGIPCFQATGEKILTIRRLGIVSRPGYWEYRPPETRGGLEGINIYRVGTHATTTALADD